MLSDIKSDKDLAQFYELIVPQLHPLSARRWSCPLSAILILCCFFNILFTSTLQVTTDQYIVQIQQEKEEDTQLNNLNIKAS